MAKNVMITFFDVEISMIVLLISVVIFLSSNESKKIFVQKLFQNSNLVQVSYSSLSQRKID